MAILVGTQGDLVNRVTEQMISEGMTNMSKTRELVRALRSFKRKGDVNCYIKTIPLAHLMLRHAIKQNEKADRKCQAHNQLAPHGS